MMPTSVLAASWHQRVAVYLDDLQLCLNRLNESLYAMRAATSAMALPPLETSQRQVAKALADLEGLIATRQNLISASDAPGPGISLHDILSNAGDTVSDELAARCGRIATEVELSRERAVAIFVCQFHLSDLTGHLLMLLRGGSSPSATYDNAGSTRRPGTSSGSLLNQSA